MLCTSWLSIGEFPHALNHATIVLILKTKSLESVKEFGPIALCNVLYTIIAKVMANRLKILLLDIIDEAQTAFVPRRAIIDNIVATFELIHYMKKKKQGPHEGCLSPGHLLKMGFASRWVELMMFCVSTITTYQWMASWLGRSLLRRASGKATHSLLFCLSFARKDSPLYNALCHPRVQNLQRSSQHIPLVIC